MNSSHITPTARAVLPALYAWPCDGYIELRALPSKRQCFTVPNDNTTRANFVRRNQGQNLYWGIATRRSDANGTEANCQHLGALFADVDFKETNEADARMRLQGIPLAPSLLVHSGGGLHCYWLLKEPLDVQTDNPRQWLTPLAAYLGADPSCAEPARVLRIPGTKNFKYDPPRPVTVEHFDPEARYNLADFEAWLPSQPVTVSASGSSTNTTGPILDGRRNDTLYRLARSLKVKGIEPPAIELSLRSVNQAQCRPPLDEREIQQIVQQATTQAHRPDFTEPPSKEPAAPAAAPVPPQTLADVEAAFARWIRDTDCVPTRALLASYVANRKLEGDPVWLMLVGGSGVGKTERLIPLAVMPDVVLESSITGPAALLSGTGKKERAKDATGGLLRKLPEGGGVLLLKDFTSIIDMHRESRAEVLAALREVYDGRWDRSVGAEGGRTLTWTGHLGLVAGCTTAIDSAHSVMSVMGTRFMLIRLQGDQDIAGSAFDHAGEERPMRDQLRATVRGLLEHLPGSVYDKAEIRQPVIALAKYVALARSPVDRDNQGEIRLVLDPEAPTRIVKMLTQLWCASGLLGLARPAAWEMVRRVGMDSIPKLRRSILDYLGTRSTTATTTDIAEYVEHPSRTTRRGLEDLAAHRVVRRIAGGEGKADHWELTDQTREWLALMTVPVSSEPIDTLDAVAPDATPLIETKITNDDITGKVALGGDTADVLMALQNDLVQSGLVAPGTRLEVLT